MIEVIGLYGGIGAMVGASMGGADVKGMIEPREEFWTGTVENNQPKFWPNLEFFPQEFRPGIIIQNTNTYKNLVTISSPPCKRFSALGVKKKKRMVNIDWESTEIYRLCIWISQIRPSIAIIENVPRLEAFFSCKESIDFSFEFGDNNLTYKLPYKVQQLQLKAMYFGVPQLRRRSFWILCSNQNNINFQFKLPDIIQLTQHCGPFLEDMEDLPNMELPNHSQKRIEGFRNLKPGTSYYGSANNKRQDPNRLADVITSHRTQHVHPTEPRTFTVRESARLMGYPDDFIFYGARTKQLDQVGMAICPPIITEFMRQIKEYYDAEEV